MISEPHTGQATRHVTSAARLELRGLTKVFGGKPAVDGVTLSIEPGSFVGVIGRSGAGKSTLLRMVNRLVDPSAGSIVYADVDVTHLRGRGLHAWRAQAAMVFQQFNLVGRLDVLTNVMLGRLYRMSGPRALLGLWSADERALAMAALEQFDMADLAAQRAESLSGGQQQRVALARALAQEPQLILADEPIASLDPRNTHLVMESLARLHRDFGLTVICNLHSVELARQYCSRLIGMSRGQVVFDGPPAALTEQSVHSLYGMTPVPPATGADSHPLQPQGDHHAPSN